MHIINRTAYVADYTTATDKSGRKHLVVIIKGTYVLPLRDEKAQLMETQLPLWVADSATGELGWSAPEYECDYVLNKPQCDVLLLGTAYAPQGIPTDRVAVGFKVGKLNKAFYVTGKRTWVGGLFGVSPGDPAPFTSQAISYDVAFGGYKYSPVHTDNPAVFLQNPVGIGFQKNPERGSFDGMPMPQTEAAGAPIRSPRRHYTPMSFGPVGRSWPQRAQYAGTYDAAWEEDTFPFLPADFDERYFQAAPEDQQLPVLTAGERVTLFNLTHPALTPSGRLDFTLPNLMVRVRFHPKQGDVTSATARADTLLIEPDQQRFSVTWRISLRLRRSSEEIDLVEIIAPLIETSQHTASHSAAHGL
ncbi:MULTISPECIES: DUF2169 family type VI secretion system accessory protein [Massilia]|uniref:DUF2169 family type VI secretion system accessory protein n=1 Tax=Massilia TaxID=149698 RepID=UPI00279662B0|nr:MULTISPECIES: DUF2169 domain-containing protein [unclassified Massilia]MDQ1835435.1 DUF2169 domain-containing protein [Massilia sp. CCM 9029]MDQ1924641.1 DUF2169 domain-containing protein [Massilia sp. CCM 9206]